MLDFFNFCACIVNGSIMNKAYKGVTLRFLRAGCTDGDSSNKAGNKNHKDYSLAMYRRYHRMGVAHRLYA